MGTIWRPALRCDSIYRDYIDSLNKVTSLDKNQIIRLMMFIAAHTDDFKQIISEYKKGDITSLPAPEWEDWEDAYWLNQTYQMKRSGVTPESIENKDVSIQKSAGGVIKVDVSSLL